MNVFNEPYIDKFMVENSSFWKQILSKLETLHSVIQALSISYVCASATVIKFSGS